MAYGRRRTRRSTRPMAVVQSYKKVLNFAPTSRAASTQVNYELVKGTDSVAAGQTGPTDAAVPTGSIIKSIEIQYTDQNLVNIASFLHVCIQRRLSGQAASVGCNVVGGSPQRNQVHWQSLRTIGQNQNVVIVKRFKIPAKYQRVREGAIWEFSNLASTIHTNACQVIYKFYR